MVISDIKTWTHAGKVKNIRYDTIGDVAQGGSTMETLATVMTERGTLNLRTQPSMESLVLAKIPQGETIRVLDRGDDLWWKVSYNGVAGYAMRQYIGEKLETNVDTGARLVIPCTDKKEAEKLMGLLKKIYME